MGATSRHRPTARCTATRLTLLALMALAVPATSWSQADAVTATLTGVVSDQTGAVLPGALVTVTALERNTTRSTTTDTNGAYRVPLLYPGTYDVRVDARGFSPFTRAAVALQVSEEAVLNASLDLAGVVVQFVVTREEQLVDVPRAKQANTVSSRQVEFLPNVRREFMPYMLILPGVSDPEPARIQNPGMAWPTAGFAVGGGNGHANLLTVDGGEHEYGTGLGRTPLNVETIQEFQVNRNALAAEFGFTAGSAVNIVTKSGSNQVSGSVYAFYRGAALAARAYFDAPGAKPSFHTWTPGGTFGAPLVRNRTFVFAAFEAWAAARLISTPFVESPEVAGPSANTSASAGLRAQETYLGQLAAAADPDVRRIGSALRESLTATNFPTTMRLLRESSRDVTAGDRRQYLTLRTDSIARTGDLLTIRFTHFRSTTDSSFVTPNPTSAPTNGGVVRAPDYALLTTWSTVLGKAAVNQLRMQVATNDARIRANAPDSTSISIDGLGTFGRNVTLPYAATQRRYQFEDTFSATTRGHSFKAGISFRPIDYTVRQELWFGGDWTFASGVFPILSAVDARDQPLLTRFNETSTDPATGSAYPAAGPGLAALSGLQSYNLGLPFLYRQAFNNPVWSDWARYLGTFAQDSWELSKRLTVDFGLRYDYDAEPTPLAHHGYAAPRLGAAWNVGKSRQTVIRGGTGLFYAPIPFQVPYVSALLDDSGRYINQVLVTPLDGIHSPPAVWARGLALGVLPNRALSEADVRALGIQTGRGGPRRVIFDVDPDYRNPYSIQGSVGASHQFAAGLTVDAAYVTYHGRHLGLSQEANYRENGMIDPLLGPQYTPIDPTIVQRNVARSIGSSTYHGMTLSLTRAYRRRYQFQMNYTLSRAEDNVTGTDAALSAFLPTALDREWARSTFDVRHMLAVHAVIQMPAGHGQVGRMLSNLSVAPVLRARSGGPFTLRIGRDVNGDTHSFYDRPFLSDRNTGQGPAFWTIDLRVSKDFPLGVGPFRAAVVADATNITNHTNFISVNDVIGTDPAFLNGPFDQHGARQGSRFAPLAFNAAVPGREIQVGVRLRF